MNKHDIFTMMKEILVAEFELDSEAVTPEAQLYTELDLDSIDTVDLIVKMKEYIPGKVDPVLFKNALTVQDVVEVLFSLTEKVEV
jgi:acyl carrier protein